MLSIRYLNIFLIAGLGLHSGPANAVRCANEIGSRIAEQQGKVDQAMMRGQLAHSLGGSLRGLFSAVKGAMPLPKMIQQYLAAVGIASKRRLLTLEILPDDATEIGRLARKLSTVDPPIRIVIAPYQQILGWGGAFSHKKRIIYIPYQEVVSGRLGPTTRHELFHAYGWINRWAGIESPFDFEFSFSLKRLSIYANGYFSDEVQAYLVSGGARIEDVLDGLSPQTPRERYSFIERIRMECHWASDFGIKNRVIARSLYRNATAAKKTRDQSGRWKIEVATTEILDGKPVKFVAHYISATEPENPVSFVKERLLRLYSESKRGGDVGQKASALLWEKMNPDNMPTDDFFKDAAFRDVLEFKQETWNDQRRAMALEDLSNDHTTFEDAFRY